MDVVNFDVEFGDFGNLVGEFCFDFVFGKLFLDECGELFVDWKVFGLVFKSIFVVFDVFVFRNDGFGLFLLCSLLSLFSGFFLLLFGNIGFGEFWELFVEVDCGDLDFELLVDDDLFWWCGFLDLLFEFGFLLFVEFGFDFFLDIFFGYYDNCGIIVNCFKFFFFVVMNDF